MRRRARHIGILAFLVGLILGACAPDTGGGSTGGELGLEEFLALDEDAAMRAYADCLRSKGWATELDPDGAAGTDVPEEQYAEYDRAALQCQQELLDAGLTLDPSRPLSEELVRHFYDEALAYHLCLEERGYPTTDAPSWEVYRASFGAEGWFWAPDSAVFEAARAADSVDVLIQAREECSP